jgi:putative ABC transport system ATP-binding protein
VQIHRCLSGEKLNMEKEFSEPFIKVQGLGKAYRMGEEVVIALRKIDLEIKRGEICCVFGASGSGKSTLLNMLAGMEPPTRGKVFIGGKEITAMSEHELAAFRQENVGFVFQAYNLLPTLTALENVAMPLTFCGIDKKKRDAMAKSVLKKVGLGDRMNHYPTQMSGGQQQRTGIARAFVHKPKLVFADEPTGNLDSKTQDQIMRMMVTFARKYNETLIIVTHNPELAAFADRIITLKDGEIIGDKPNESVMKQ